jgi:hypothetical protein
MAERLLASAWFGEPKSCDRNRRQAPKIREVTSFVSYGTPLGTVNHGDPGGHAKILDYELAKVAFASSSSSEIASVHTDAHD